LDLDNIKVPEGPRDINLVWTDYTDPANPMLLEPQIVTWTQQNWLEYVCRKTLFLLLEILVPIKTYKSRLTTVVKNVILSVNVIGGKQGPITSYPTPDGYVENGYSGPAGFILSNPTQVINCTNKQSKC
jgi:hypothetical protein